MENNLELQARAARKTIVKKPFPIEEKQNNELKEEAPLFGKIIFTKTQEKVLRKFFCWVHKRRYKKKLKQSDVRLRIIKELIKTEETYISKLHLITDELLSGMKSILKNENDIQSLFNNIEQIQQLNEDVFLKLMKDKTAKLEFNSKVFDQDILKIIPFFKIYSDYIQNYANSIKFFQKLIETRKDVQEFIKEFENQNEYISNILITPVQRLPRYGLLFKELVHKTSEDHQDYKVIKRCYSEFEGVCSQVNAASQKYLDNQKILELALSFKEDNLQLIEKGREFVLQEIISLPEQNEERLTLINDGEKNCLVSFLKDLILVQERIDEENTKPLCWDFLNSRSQVKSCEDMKYYKHIFKVSGENNILTFMADNKKQKDKLIDQIQLLITNNWRSDSDLENIEVNILGTEEWNTTKIQKFTVYVAEIKIVNVSLKIWVRYSQLEQIEKKIKPYAQDIQFDHSNTAFTWLSNNKTKTIEHRKIQFEIFLRKVLTNKEIKNSPIISTILTDLGLPKEFYDLPYRQISQNEDFEQGMNGLTNYEGESSSDDDYEEENKDESNHEDIKITNRMSSGTIRSTVSQQIGSSINRSSFLREKSSSVGVIGKISASETYKLNRLKNISLNRQSYSGGDAIKQGDRCLLDIEFLDKTSRSVEIDEETRCFCICQNIAKKIGLKSFLDFRLFLVDSQRNMRILDNDEILFKTLFPSEKSLKHNAQLISQFNVRSSEPTIKQEAEAEQNLSSSDKLNSSQSLKTDSLTSSENRMSQLWQYSSTKDTHNKNVWQQLLSQVRQNEKYTIIFKKYLWLSTEQEEFDIRKDPVRLRLICFQIFQNVSLQKYKFSFKDYSLFASLYLYIKYTEIAKQLLSITQNQANSHTFSRNSFLNLFQSHNNNNESLFPLDKIKEIIPEAIYNSQDEQIWIEQTISTLETISSQVDKIEQNNREKLEILKAKKKSKQRASQIQFQQSTISNDSSLQQSYDLLSLSEQQGVFESLDQSEGYLPSIPPKQPSQSQFSNLPPSPAVSESERSKEQIQPINNLSEQNSDPVKIAKHTSKQILSEKIQLMQMVVINAIKNNMLFGVSQFYLNTYKDTLKEAKEINLNIQENVWLGIKHDMIYVLGPEFKEVLLKFPYSDLSQKKVFPKQFHLTLASLGKDLKFNTSQSFEISQLISEYQSIENLLNTPPSKEQPPYNQ